MNSIIVARKYNTYLDEFHGAPYTVGRDDLKGQSYLARHHGPLLAFYV